MNTTEIKRENHINLYNEKGEKHGLWEDYYSNGELHYRINYANGKEHGVWESYYRDGQLNYRGNYENGQKHGLWEGYFSDGQLSIRGNYVNGQKHGVWEDYYSNGGQLNYRKEYNMGKEVQPITELTLDEIAEKFGVPVGQLKIKK